MDHPLPVRLGHRRLLRLYYALTFCNSLLFALPIWVNFGPDYLGTSFAMGIILVSTPNLVSALLDLPTGAWADRWGRRRVLWWGQLLSLANMVPFVLTRNVWILAACIPLAGLGYAMISGSLDAIVSAATHEQPDTMRVATSHKTAAAYLARIAASLTGGWLYAHDPRLPFVALTAATLVALGLALMLPSTGDSPTGGDNPHAVRQVVALFTRHRDLLVVLGLDLLMVFIGNLQWVAYQPAFRAVGVSSVAMGAVFAGLSLAPVAGAYAAKMLMRRFSTATLFVLLLAVTVAVGVALARLHNLAIVAVLIGLNTSVGVLAPTVTTYLATRAPREVKTTMISMLGISRGSMFLASLAGGLLLDHTSILTLGWVSVAATVIFGALIPWRWVRVPTVAPAAYPLARKTGATTPSSSR